ncbi:DNA polymerase delta catalytic subunit-like [Vigna umbellata]|uniref:DNA polymerase delta catalytic subunit-like n=1 Tax=Vigna umbellata TaxID=87088 RepID=UPI001F5F9934|nr:DNA polymerase delta catalytic subunit-like [Vigna umbellata]
MARIKNFVAFGSGRIITPSVHIAKEGKLSYIVKRYLECLSWRCILGSCGHSVRSAKVHFIKIFSAQVGIVQSFIDERRHRKKCLKHNHNWTGGAFKFGQEFDLVGPEGQSTKPVGVPHNPDIIVRVSPQMNTEMMISLDIG